MLRDTERADRVIQFIEKLTIPDGPALGQKIVLDQWEIDWIRDIYEPVREDGRPVVSRAVLSVARKNRKSLLVGGLVLATLIGPESQPNAQIYSAAVDFEQAKVIFDMVVKMLEFAPSLRRHLKIVESRSRIVVKSSGARGRGSVYRALSATNKGKHGLGADFFVYDEFGEASDDELWNVLYDSQQLRARPLAVVISTQTNDPLHPLSLLIDDGLRRDENGNKLDPTTVCHLYAADEDCDILDEAQWLKANPTLATWKPRKQIAEAAAEAARRPEKEANFRQRYLNQRVNPFSTLISQSAWKGVRAPEDQPVEFQPGEQVYLALDMSKRDDLTALVMISADNVTRVKAWFWKPAILVPEHAKRDGVPYDAFAATGWLDTVHGAMIKPRTIAEKIAELSAQYDVLGLAYDRFFTAELMNHLEEIGLFPVKGERQSGALRVVDWGQGWVDMSPAVTAFEEAIVTQTLVHDGNPLLTMCVMNALVMTDSKGNRSFDKAKSRNKIDGAVALAMALGLKSRERIAAPITSPWEDADFKMMVI